MRSSPTRSHSINIHSVRLLVGCRTSRSVFYALYAHLSELAVDRGSPRYPHDVVHVICVWCGLAISRQHCGDTQILSHKHNRNRHTSVGNKLGSIVSQRRVSSFRHQLEDPVRRSWLSGIWTFRGSWIIFCNYQLLCTSEFVYCTCLACVSIPIRMHSSCGGTRRLSPHEPQRRERSINRPPTVECPKQPAQRLRSLFRQQEWRVLLLSESRWCSALSVSRGSACLRYGSVLCWWRMYMLVACMRSVRGECNWNKLERHCKLWWAACCGCVLIMETRRILEWRIGIKDAIK